MAKVLRVYLLVIPIDKKEVMKRYAIDQNDVSVCESSLRRLVSEFEKVNAWRHPEDKATYAVPELPEFPENCRPQACKRVKRKWRFPFRAGRVAA